MEFILGCNYWASNAGTEMWRMWDESAIREDLRVLSENGVKYMRVFPNWRDFQPITAILGQGGEVLEYSLEGDKRAVSADYLDENMLRRFDTFCDLCEEYGIKLIVGLITGWMSGRTFIPAALIGKNLYTDSVALLFEMRLIRGMVTRFKHKKSIYAWDLGNECNCFGKAQSEQEATAWSLAVANAIRAYDSSRPVISGMHSLVAGSENGAWTIRGQAEACDVLTTHPYPFWVEHAGKDEIASMRTALHATCETKYYSDIGKRPALVEEIGTMGPMICDDKHAADFMRVNLFSNWAHGASGLMWWCANEQTMLTTPPYTYQMCELELGMRYADGSPKPMLREMGRVGKILNELPFSLPRAKENATCLVTRDTQQWGVAYMTFCLAKQAGLNIGYAWCDDELPDSEVYMMPSVKGHRIMSRDNYLALRKRVFEGASLYISFDGGILAEFEALAGLHVVDSCEANETDNVCLDGEKIDFYRSRRLNVVQTTAEVIAYDASGIPAVTANKYGKGTVYFVNFPLEAMLLNRLGAMDGDYYKVYSRVFSSTTRSNEVRTQDKYVGITLHPCDDGKIICVAINYSPFEREPGFEIKQPLSVKRVFYGDINRIPAFDAVIFEIG